MRSGVKIGVGDERIEWSRLGVATDLKRIVLITEDGGEQEVGTTTEELEVLEESGRTLLGRTQRLESELLGNRVDTTLVVLSTFEPVSYRSSAPGLTVSVDYRGRHVMGERRREGEKKERIAVTLPQAVFDAHSIEMVLRVLPLEQGYRADLPIFDAVSGQLQDARVEVRGKEVVSGDKGAEEEAWHVEAHYGTTRIGYWMAARTPELLKQVVDLPDGSVLAFVR